MIGAERLKLIGEAVAKSGAVSISDLSERFKVSEATVRRDLSKLEKQGLLRRTYGGAVSRQGSSVEAPFSVREQLHVAEKRAIALVAAELVSSSETIVVDAGTTTAELARALRNHSDLTVITNSERVMNELYDCPEVSVFVVGGELNPLSGLPAKGDIWNVKCQPAPDSDQTSHG